MTFISIILFCSVVGDYVQVSIVSRDWTKIVIQTLTISTIISLFFFKLQYIVYYMIILLFKLIFTL